MNRRNGRVVAGFLVLTLVVVGLLMMSDNASEAGTNLALRKTDPQFQPDSSQAKEAFIIPIVGGSELAQANPSEEEKKVVEPVSNELPVIRPKPSLKKPSKVAVERPRVWLGISPASMRHARSLLKNHLNIESGASVGKVVEGGPAESAGLRATDVILKLDGTVLADYRDFVNRALKDKKPGEMLSLEVLRNGVPMSLNIELGSREKEPTRPFIGITTSNGIFPALYANLGVEDGYAIGYVSGGSPAAEAGLEAYDLIVGIDGKEASSRSLNSTLSGYKPGDVVELSLIRDGARLSRSVTLGELPSRTKSNLKNVRNLLNK